MRSTKLGAGLWRVATAGPSSSRTFATTCPRQDTWGFVGLGAMGYPMATNLRAKIPASDTLIIHDVNEAATQKFQEEVGIAAKAAGAPGKGTGIEIASSLRSLAEQSDTVITVLPEPRHVKDVFHHFLNGGIPQKNGNERLFIDCSTIDPTSSREVASAVHSTSSGRFVDAPMSGGVVGARAGTLTFMLGASSSSGALIERAKKVLMLMGKKVWHLGEQGSGLSGKLANNYLLAINNIATAEAMNLGIKWGLDPKTLGDMINSSTGKCWPSEINNPVPGVVEGNPSSRGYEGGFGVSLMNKDLRLAIAAADEAGAKLMLGKKAKEVYDATEAEYKGKDFSIVYKYIKGD